MALSRNGEVRTVDRVVIAGISGRQDASDVITRLTAQRLRHVSVALALVDVTSWTVERIVVAAVDARRRGW